MPTQKVILYLRYVLLGNNTGCFINICVLIRQVQIKKEKENCNVLKTITLDVREVWVIRQEQGTYDTALLKIQKTASLQNAFDVLCNENYLVVSREHCEVSQTTMLGFVANLDFPYVRALSALCMHLKNPNVSWD